jgi:Squalene-hopene cyclase C-terminal domain/Prenyltransferase and squalene oxidase repeat
VSFADQVCVPFLRKAQNEDGGWGYGPGASSGVEPTAWTLLALAASEDRTPHADAIRRGADWLVSAQLRDGSWPAFPGQEHGYWVTALGCLALRELEAAPESVARAAQWLCNAWPAEGSFWWRLRARLFARKLRSVVGQDISLRGWSWTAGTSSWVEPTAFALLALRRVDDGSIAAQAERRRQMGEALLFDRMCPGGGWNCGNPMVYGTPGRPQVEPTVWALLALGERKDSAEVTESLNWLERGYREIHGPASLALAHLCLCVYGRNPGELEPGLAKMYAANEFLDKVAVMAWAALALSPPRRWFGRSEEARS